MEEVKTESFFWRLFNYHIFYTDLFFLKKKSIGCLIDIDGVVLQGGVPFQCSKKAFQVII